MYHRATIILWICLIYLQVKDIYCQTKTVSSCSNEPITLACPENQHIGIERVFYGVKQDRNCSTQGQSYSRNCCRREYRDCLVYNNDIQKTLNSKCSGKTVCEYPTPSVSSGSYCTDPTMKTTDYMSVMYQCIPDADFVEICTDNEKKGKTVYLSNEDYPVPIKGEKNCTCLVSSDSDYGIVVSVIDVLFPRQSQVCGQKLVISDNVTRKVEIGCGWPVYGFRDMFSSGSSKVSLSLVSSADSNNGYMWLRIRPRLQSDMIAVTCTAHVAPDVPVKTTQKTTTTTKATTKVPATTTVQATTKGPVTTTRPVTTTTQERKTTLKPTTTQQQTTKAPMTSTTQKPTTKKEVKSTTSTTTRTMPTTASPTTTTKSTTQARTKSPTTLAMATTTTIKSKPTTTSTMVPKFTVPTNTTIKPTTTANITPKPTTATTTSTKSMTTTKVMTVQPSTMKQTTTRKAMAKTTQRVVTSTKSSMGTTTRAVTYNPGKRGELNPDNDSTTRAPKVEFTSIVIDKAGGVKEPVKGDECMIDYCYELIRPMSKILVGSFPNTTFLNTFCGNMDEIKNCLNGIKGPCEYSGQMESYKQLEDDFNMIKQFHTILCVEHRKDLESFEPCYSKKAQMLNNQCNSMSMPPEDNNGEVKMETEEEQCRRLKKFYACIVNVTSTCGEAEAKAAETISIKIQKVISGEYNMDCPTSTAPSFLIGTSWLYITAFIFIFLRL